MAGTSKTRRNRLDYLTRTGRLVKILPGTYTAPRFAENPTILARAFTAAHPTAVVVGRSAAALTYWPELEGLPVEIVDSHLVENPLFRVRRASIPDELIGLVHGIPVTRPALTALDLCLGDVGPEAIDRVLLRGGTTLDDLHRALRLTRGRWGNRARRRLLKDSATMGCSELERRAHRVLRRAGITEWVANRRYRIGDSILMPDIRFTRVRLLLEFDGYAFHHQREAFESDRTRDNLAQLHRFIALRFTHLSLEDEGEFVRQVRAAERLAQPY